MKATVVNEIQNASIICGLLVTMSNFYKHDVELCKVKECKLNCVWSSTGFSESVLRKADVYVLVTFENVVLLSAITSI